MATRSKKVFRPLNTRERLYLCKFIADLVLVARDEDHPMRGMARKEISATMWRWTADGVCVTSGIVKQDAFKYKFSELPSTREARVLGSTTQKGLRHEHVVPRMLLTDRIIEGNLSIRAIFRLLTRYCKAVIVTKEEDSLLSRSKMPKGWSWDDGCEYARYKEVDLYRYLEVM